MASTQSGDLSLPTIGENIQSELDDNTKNSDEAEEHHESCLNNAENDLGVNVVPNSQREATPTSMLKFSISALLDLHEGPNRPAVDTSSTSTAGKTTVDIQ